MAWWNALEMTMKVLYIIASTSTLILAIQMILSMFGLGSEDLAVSDVEDLSADVVDAVDVADSGEISGIDGVYTDTGVADQGGFSNFDVDGLRIFSLRGILAFFSIGSWTVIVAHNAGLNIWISLLIGLVAGLIVLYLIAVVMRWAVKLQSSGNINIKNAVGLSGSVYLTIPPKDKGRGKVSVIVQERLREYDAITYDTERIPTGLSVKVTAVILPDILVVERI